MKKEKSCGAIVYREKDGVEILLIKHKNGGHWAFPKGHVEKKDDTDMDTVTDTATAAMDGMAATAIIPVTGN